MTSLFKIFLDPHPTRTAFILLARKLKLFGYERRVQMGAVPRPPYGYCLYHAALLAHKLNEKKISVIEFGVAGGNGLLNLEYHAREIEKIIPVQIEIYGFDTGEGLPRPLDYRDISYRWKEGFYKMDVPRLKSRLKKARLILGDVKDSIRTFCSEYNPAPIAAIMFDLDFYSSTMEALKIFDTDEKFLLPRIFCYFDDVIGTESHLFNDWTGERLAIREFNDAHPQQKISFAWHLLGRKGVDPWCHKIFIQHNFAHSRYNDFISEEDQQLQI